MEPQTKWRMFAGALILGLIIGGAAGYYFGLQQGESRAQRTATPTTASTNPLGDVSTNPLENVKTNPFE